MATEDIEIPATAGLETAPASTDDADPTTGATTQARTRAYSVAPGIRLNVRGGPGVHHRVVRVLPEGATVQIHCQRPGDTVTGYYGTSNIWDCIANGQFVSDTYVNTGSDGYVAARCS
ncbi:hypothetical protein ADL00_38530 [Streptomyces sp. AS58]|uniref:hypothetical protein n=1 Tax=Streptomyces sp. AS58 TaxID=1519489 RepID=UPI0006AE0086|nr:hypothetical protein [Streptomyces sp. AS58]KOV52001.1 hypothetical protein ADL00_38530 [Streptomyces sp. AS58]